MTTHRRRASGCAPEGIDCRPTQSSAFGLYRVTLMATAGRPSWSIAVHDAKGDPVAATVQIDGGAPRSGRVFTIGPLSTASDGRTIVDGFEPDAREWWVLRVGIDGPPGRDAVTFNVIAQGWLDGIPERRNAAGEFLGVEGVERLVTGLKGQSAKAIAAAVISAADAFADGLATQDDMTVVVVRRQDRPSM